MPAKEEIWYVVPEIEIRVHSSWIELVKYCQDKLPYGEMTIKINNALPGERLKETPNIRFDRVHKSRDNGVYYKISSLDVRVHESWINLISWCQNYFVAGTIIQEFVNACPTKLHSAKPIVRFDKPETIPPGLPLEFGVLSKI